MKTKRIFIILTTMLLALLIALCGCGNQNQLEQTTDEIVSQTPEDDGYKFNFTLEVVDDKGNQTFTDFATNKEFVGEVLSEHGIIKGEQGEYGLYVKEVNGILADYETTGTYWAFYVNGEMSMTGVDQTPIVDGATYSLKIEK